MGADYSAGNGVGSLSAFAVILPEGVRETCGCRASHYSTLSAAPLSVRPAELSTHQSVLLGVEKSIQIDTLLPLLPFPVACASKRALRWIYSRRLRVSTLPLPADCKNLFVCRGAGQNKQASTGRTLPKRVIRTADVMCNTVIRCGARGGPVRCSGLLCTDVSQINFTDTKSLFATDEATS
jgi:hypothetical protein